MTQTAGAQIGYLLWLKKNLLSQDFKPQPSLQKAVVGLETPWASRIGCIRIYYLCISAVIRACFVLLSGVARDVREGARENTMGNTKGYDLNVRLSASGTTCKLRSC